MKQGKRQRTRIIIKIKDNQKKITINKKAVNYLAKQILKVKGVKEAELSIVFVGQNRIRTLNRKFRKVDRPTDVLAFSMREVKGIHFPCVLKRAGRVHPELLGDVVICPEIARKRAKIYRTTENREIYLYLTHGILHLLGYEDMNGKSFSVMKQEQQRILKKVLKG